MKDARIIELFWQRDETALTEVENKYANYCFAIAWKILMNRKTPKNVSTTPGWRRGTRFRRTAVHTPKFSGTHHKKLCHRYSQKKIWVKSAFDGSTGGTYSESRSMGFGMTHVGKKVI